MLWSPVRACVSFTYGLGAKFVGGAISVGKGVSRGAMALAAKVGESVGGKKIVFKLVDLTRTFLARTGASGRLTLLLSEMRSHFVGIALPAFRAAQRAVNAVQWGSFGLVIKGFAMQVVNDNLFSFQQLELLRQEEEIGSMIDRAVAVNPNINFNIGALMYSRISSP